MVTYNREMTLLEFEKGEYDYSGYESLLYVTSPFDELESYTTGDYQGETAVVLFNRITYKFGFLSFSYGSCSGCDAYYGCDGDEKCLLELRNDLFRSVTWFDNIKEVLKFFNKSNERWESQWYDFVNHNDAIRKILSHENKYIKHL